MPSSRKAPGKGGNGALQSKATGSTVSAQVLQNAGSAPDIPPQALLQIRANAAATARRVALQRRISGSGAPRPSRQPATAPTRAPARARPSRTLEPWLGAELWLDAHALSDIVAGVRSVASLGVRAWLPLRILSPRFESGRACTKPVTAWRSRPPRTCRTGRRHRRRSPCETSACAVRSCRGCSRQCPGDRARRRRWHGPR